MTSTTGYSGFPKGVPIVAGLPKREEGSNLKTIAKVIACFVVTVGIAILGAWLGNHEFGHNTSSIKDYFSAENYNSTLAGASLALSLVIFLGFLGGRFYDYVKNPDCGESFEPPYETFEEAREPLDFSSVHAQPPPSAPKRLSGEGEANIAARQQTHLDSQRDKGRPVPLSVHEVASRLSLNDHFTTGTEFCPDDESTDSGSCFNFWPFR